MQYILSEVSVSCVIVSSSKSFKEARDRFLDIGTRIYFDEDKVRILNLNESILQLIMYRCLPGVQAGSSALVFTIARSMTHTPGQ